MAGRRSQSLSFWPAGVRVSPPWRFDITKLVTSGENRVEVLVCNTLANHYTTVPTHYRGDTTSGLLGPVTLQFSEGRSEDESLGDGMYPADLELQTPQRNN